MYTTSTDPIEINTLTYVLPPELTTADGNYLTEAVLIANHGTTPYENMPDADSDDMETKILYYTEQILTLINGLQTLFSSEAYMQWSLSLKDQEEETLSFVQTAVEVFLSYTTELYYTTYKKSYNSFSEILPLAEELHQRLEGTKMDFMFYDETLEIEEKV